MSLAIFRDSAGIHVMMQTERLQFVQVEDTDKACDHLAGLFGDAQVVEKYATGETKTREHIQKRIQDVWAKRWKEGDPYSAFLVFKRDATRSFLGWVVLGHRAPGEAELAYVFHKAHWHQGYGTEAVAAVVTCYAPTIARMGYLLDGKTLTRVVATSRGDNKYSCLILDKFMKYDREVKEHGADRRLYVLELPSVMEAVTEQCST